LFTPRLPRVLRPPHKPSFHLARAITAGMAESTPEELAKEFARRWLRDVSSAMRDMGEKELAQIIRDAITADRKHRGQRDAA